MEIDAVQNDVEVAFVRFDLRMMGFAEGVFDRKRVEMEGVGEQMLALVCRRLNDICPERHTGRGVEPLRLDPVCLLRLAVLIDVDRDHVWIMPFTLLRACFSPPRQFPTFTDKAASAAARSATGAR